MDSPQLGGDHPRRHHPARDEALSAAEQGNSQRRIGVHEQEGQQLRLRRSGLNKYTSNVEFFHCCDLTVAVNVWTVPDYTSRWVKVTYPSTGKIAVLRVNDYGPAIRTGRSIDFTCRGSTNALGTYATDTPITFQFQK